MANLLSNRNEEKPTNRSESSTMYNIDQIPLARLRPEKFDDAAIQKQILLIRDACGDVSLDVIAVVFHECDYNIQHTIARIKAGDYEDSEWQTAKSSNKKKNNNQIDQTINGSGGGQSDSEKSPSQHTSPGSSLRGNDRRRRRQDNYQHLTARTNFGRRGNDPGRNQHIPTNPSRNTFSTDQSLSKQENSSELISVSNTNPTKALSTDEFVFTDSNTQSLTFNINPKKTSILSSTKRPMPSSIPQVAVSMHPILNYPSEPLDIQFGDVQWNDSVPIIVSPSNSSIEDKSFDNEKPSSLSHMDYVKDEEITQVDETTAQLSSFTLSNTNPSGIPLKGTSHLSDSLRQEEPLQIATASAPLIERISDTLEYNSPTIQTNPTSFMPNTFQPSVSNTTNIPGGGNQSAFTPYTTAPGAHPSMLRDMTQVGSAWNPQSSSYKMPTKASVIQPSNYTQQASYPMQPQQFFLTPYGYPAQIYPYYQSADSWSTAGPDPYAGYPPATYMPAYTTPQAFHPSATVQSNKFDRSSHEKDFFANYGQARISNSELSNASQTSKDTLTTSKLSANAASFSQGAPLTATSPGTTLLVNPVLYPMPTVYPDRSMAYPSLDTRDNRNGASYTGNHSRNPYHHFHQRSHNNNSTWHSQQ